MRKLVWATLFLAVIGFASAAVLVSINIPGTIRVERPSLLVNPTSFGTIVLTGIGTLTGTATLTITNSGTVGLTLASRCTCPAELSLSLSSPQGPLGFLAPGAIWDGTVTFTVSSTAVGGDYPFLLIIEG